MRFFTFLSIMLVVSVITSCSDNSIVGTYQFGQQLEENLSWIGQRSFNEDGSFEINATMTNKIAGYGEYKFSVSFSGIYSVKDRKLSLIADINTIKVVSDKNQYSSGERFAAELQERFQQGFASGSIEEEIIAKTKEQMITKEKNSEAVTYRRLR